jgi:hypothetical protein
VELAAREYSASVTENAFGANRKVENLDWWALR